MRAEQVLESVNKSLDNLKTTMDAQDKKIEKLTDKTSNIDNLATAQIALGENKKSQINWVYYAFCT